MKKELTEIKRGHIVKRALAIIMDGCVAIFAFFSLVYFVFSPIANKAMHYRELTDKASKFQLDSHLYVKLDEESSSNYALFDINEKQFEKVEEKLEIEDGVSFLKDKLHYYYLNFKTGNVEDGLFFADDYNVEISQEDGSKILPVNYYTEDWFANKFNEVTTIKDCLLATEEAALDFGEYYAPLQKEIMKRELFIIIPSYVISFGCFFILVPLLYKNGETFGKKILHLGFVTKDGYSVQKRQIVTRQLFIFVLITIAAFGFTVGFGSLTTLMFGVALYVIATAISKSWRSVADYLAYTQLINTRDSVWFDDPKAEQEKEQQVKEQLSKYNEYKPENKNLIQVGTTIVDEEVKKEFLESKKKGEKTEK